MFILSGIRWIPLRVGDIVDENELTNYDTLLKLINKYNDVIAKTDVERLDKSIVAIRDAFAHGRVLALAEANNYRIVKFSIPKKGKVESGAGV